MRQCALGSRNGLKQPRQRVIEWRAVGSLCAQRPLRQRCRPRPRRHCPDPRRRFRKGWSEDICPIPVTGKANSAAALTVDRKTQTATATQAPQWAIFERRASARSQKRSTPECRRAILSAVLHQAVPGNSHSGVQPVREPGSGPRAGSGRRFALANAFSPFLPLNGSAAKAHKKGSLSAPLCRKACCVCALRRSTRSSG